MVEHQKLSRPVASNNDVAIIASQSHHRPSSAWEPQHGIISRAGLRLKLVKMFRSYSQNYSH